MAAPWLTVLKHVPWNDVIGNAPVVADGARKLWGAVARKTGLDGASADEPAAATAPAPAPAATPAEPARPSAEALAIEALQVRVAQLDTAQRDLQAQLRTGTELISQLAEQNTQLIARVDQLRLRLRWTLAGLGLGVVLGIAALVVALARV